MPLNYGSARRTPVVVSITDPGGAAALSYVSVAALFLDGTAEAVYSAGAFLGDYVAGSSQQPTAGGVGLSILPGSGWPAAPSATTPLAIGLQVSAADSGGVVTTSTLYYQMPPASTLVPAAAVAPITAAVDLAAEILTRIVWQLRS
jgi:hypothetical protein